MVQVSKRSTTLWASKRSLAWFLPTTIVELCALAVAWPLQGWRFGLLAGLMLLANVGRRIQFTRGV